MYNNMAKDITGEKPYLQCSTCNRRIDLSINDIARQLANGWKKCCGYTMTYYSGK